MPEFCVWVIGGGIDEAQRLFEDIRRRPGCSSMHDAARLFVWGRVDTDCLPEIYSRASLIVMPSRRETFGLVAVQSMLCGTAVAASFIGGLKHTVVHRQTGFHFAAGDVTALAFIMRSIVCNHRLVGWLGNNAEHWAKEAFGHNSPNGGWARILRAQAGQTLEPHPLERPTEFFLAEDIDAIRLWLGQECKVESVATVNNATFKVHCLPDSVAFVKRFTTRPDFDFSIYQIDNSLTPSDWRARLARTTAASTSPFVLPIRDTCDRMALFDWATPARIAQRGLIFDVARKFSASLGIPSQTLVGECLLASKAFVKSGAWVDLAAFDRAAASLNKFLNGRDDVFVRCDPRVEIMRQQMHLDAGAWPIPTELRSSMRAVLNRATKFEINRVPSALVRHGDLRTHHFLEYKDKLVLCDLEESRVAFGDLDMASLMLQQARMYQPEEAPITSLLVDLKLRYPEVDDYNFVVLWFIAQAFHLALGKAAWGSLGELHRAILLCQRALKI
jgi:hypothetical protein